MAYKILVPILLFIIATTASAGFFITDEEINQIIEDNFVILGGGSGTMNVLPQLKSTSSPYTAITTRTHGKDLYFPHGSATTSDLSVISLANCDTIDTDANGFFSCGSDNAGVTFGQAWEIIGGYLAPTTTQNILQTGTLDVVGLTTLSSFNATSTTATSTFAAGIQATYLDLTGTSATSTFANGIWIEGGGLTLDNFTNCNLDTDGSGHLVCGTDADSGGLWTDVGSYLVPTGNHYIETNYFKATSTSASSIIDYRLGIGTSSPFANLSVGHEAGETAFAIGSSTTNFIVDSSGNVGIGITDPTHSLHISGDAFLTHTATMADEHALEIKVDAADFGDVKAIDIFYDTGAISTGEDEGIILLDIDRFSSGGGDVFGLEVLATEGTAEVYGMKVGIGIHPISQFTGIFGDMDVASTTALGTAFLDYATSTDLDATMFASDNDVVVVGDIAKFEELEFILATESSKNINPTFEFSTSTGAWETFTPIDGTDGMERNGVIVWDDADIPTWDTGTGGNYLIRITRTRNNIVTDPVEDKIQISAVTEYKWDQNGDILVRNATTTSATTTNMYVSSWLNIANGKDYRINGTSVLNASTLGSGVTASSLTSLGTIANLTATYASSTAISAINLDLSGNVTSGGWAGSVIGDAYITKTGAWTGTWDSNNIAGGAIGAGNLVYASSNGELAATSTANLKATLFLDLVENTAISSWAGSGNILTVGALDTGSITGNFGNIDTGASTIDTTGTVSFGGTTVNTGSTLTVDDLTSAMVLTGAGGVFAEYTGADCTNQFIRDLSALGAPTCGTVGAADVSLANLTATDTTLTFSGTYDGSTARTIGLNLGNANSWTALQTFANATSTLFSSTYASSTAAHFGTLTATGVVDFGGATFESPHGADFTFSAIGQHYFDTTDMQFQIATTTADSPVVIPTMIKLFGGGLSSTSPDFVSGGIVPTTPQRDGFVVREINCIVDGGTSVVINLSSIAGNTDSETVTCDADGQADTDITTNYLYAAGSYNRIELGTVTGAVDYFTYSVWGHILPE